MGIIALVTVCKSDYPVLLYELKYYLNIRPKDIHENKVDLSVTPWFSELSQPREQSPMQFLSLNWNTTVSSLQSHPQQ